MRFILTENCIQDGEKDRESGIPKLQFDTRIEVEQRPAVATRMTKDKKDEGTIRRKGHNAGLHNLINTCFMNSVLQCLYAIPELQAELIKYCGNPDKLKQFSHLLTVATRDLFNELDCSEKPVFPSNFWEVLCEGYPQYTEKKQEDAEECWTRVVNGLSESLGQSVMQKLFGIELLSSYKTEFPHLLECYVNPRKVKNLHQGLEHGLTNALISELPRYLTVQFMRFSSSNGVTRKIKREVVYPLELDVCDLCTVELCEKLKASRKVLIYTQIAELIVVLKTDAEEEKYSCF